MTSDALRMAMALSATLLYAALCLAIWLRWQRARRQAATARKGPPGNGAARPILVAHASQTGTAAQLAAQTATALGTAGVATRLLPLGALDAETLRTTDEALFVVSTYGEGDAPDAAVRFASTLMHQSVPLAHLHYGILALGDRGYRHFCGFGRALDDWLARQGAQPMFERIDVSNSDAAALLAWRHRLSHLAGTADLPDWQGPAFADWTLRSRQHLNPGSAGGHTYHLELTPPVGAVVDWEAGDLLQVQLPKDPGRPREYSIASVPADGAVHLLVRLERRADGSFGMASDWLTQGLAVGGTLAARVRSHASFRIGANAGRDLILIGNGTGLAGLRAHLRARAAQRAAGHAVPRAWLFFGERNAQFDHYYRGELAAWERDGLLPRLDLVYSRDQQAHRHVQDRVRYEAVGLRAWVQAGAAIYVSGSLEGMASGVDAALREVLGPQALEEMQVQGRYRRDVY